MIEVAYNVVASIGVLLVIYVMQKTEHDRINKIDPVALQWFRRLAFIISGLALCYSMWSTDWQRSLPILCLVGAGVVNLAVNAVALHLRSPPTDGRRVRNPSPIGIGIERPKIHER